jgi:hypothetical protein
MQLEALKLTVQLVSNLHEMLDFLSRGIESLLLFQC